MIDGSFEVIKNDIALFLKDHMNNIDGVEERFSFWAKTLLSGNGNCFTRFQVFERLSGAYREYQNYISIKDEYERMLKKREVIAILITLANYIELKLKGETDEAFGRCV